MKRLTILAFVWICFLSQSGWAQDQTIIINDPPTKLENSGKYIKNATLTLATAKDLITDTLGAKALQPDSYCIIHVLKWKNTGDKTSVETQHWYLYHDGKWSEKEFEGLRIFGNKNVALLYVHLDELEGVAAKIVYKVNVVKKLPAPILDLKALIEAAAATKRLSISPENVWGGAVMTIDHIPSDMNVIALKGDLEGGDQKEIGKQTYDNEGRYHWDVSVGLPVTKVKELSFNADDGTVRAKEIDRQKLFAFFNFYPKPIDTKGTKILPFPHLVAGVALSKKPLDRLFAGGGWGLNKVHFFAGVAFNKVESPKTLATGAMATSSQLSADLKSRYQRKFIFGLDLPVRQVVDALKGNK